MTASDEVGAFRDFEEALDNGRLAIPRCRSCRRAFWYPRVACPWCGARSIDWTRTVSTGTVYARTVAHRGSAPAGRELPYVLALIEIDSEIRLISTIVGAGATEIEAGDQVELHVTATDDGPLPQWRPAERQRSSVD